MDETAGGLGRRVLAWVIIIAVAIIALKLAFGIVFGFLQMLISVALLVVVVMSVLWALRHICDAVPDHLPVLRARRRLRGPRQGLVVPAVVPDLGADPVPGAARGDPLPLRARRGAPPVPALRQAGQALRPGLHGLRSGPGLPGDGRRARVHGRAPSL